MHRFVFLFITIFAMVIAVPIIAQIYEYRDADGNIRFTDELGNVPEDIRENVKEIRAISSTPQSSQHQEKSIKIENPSWENNDTSEVGIDLVEQREVLRQEQQSLQEDYDYIQKEKAMIGEPPGQDASREDFDAYGERVEAINTRIVTYQKKLEDHEDRVKKYNAKFIK